MIVLIGRWRKNPIESANEVRFAIKTRAGPPRGREGQDGTGRDGTGTKRDGTGRNGVKRREGGGRGTGGDGGCKRGAREGTGTGVDGCRRPKGRNKCTHCAELVD